MTNIRATCPTCGEIDLTADDIHLKISSNEEASIYKFECPSCVETVCKPADSRIIQLLISGGVRATLMEGPSDPSDPVFTYDDLLDFHMELESEEAIAAFLNADHI